MANRNSTAPRKPSACDGHTAPVLSRTDQTRSASADWPDPCSAFPCGCARQVLTGQSVRLAGRMLRGRRCCCRLRFLDHHVDRPNSFPLSGDGCGRAREFSEQRWHRERAGDDGPRLPVGGNVGSFVDHAVGQLERPGERSIVVLGRAQRCHDATGRRHHRQRSESRGFAAGRTRSAAAACSPAAGRVVFVRDDLADESVLLEQWRQRFGVGYANRTRRGMHVDGHERRTVGDDHDVSVGNWKRHRVVRGGRKQGRCAIHHADHQR